MTRRWVVAAVLAAASSTMAAPAAAQPEPAGDAPQQTGDSAQQGPTLTQYLEAMAEQRLLAEETGSVERLRALVRRAEQMYFDGRFHEASILLFRVAESPRFADFVELEEFRGAEYMLAGALQELGALRTASRYLEHILERGPSGRYFGPAFRRFVDVALQSGELDAAIARLEGLSLDLGALPEDAANELRYLRGRAAYDAGELEQAEARFVEITRRSRFYAGAQYLRGVIDARARNLQAAEDHFCAIATQEDQDHFSFYVDERFFEVKDLAWLALGRVAHEGGRSDDAFYYYFQVPQDSDRVTEALFESAYAMYEGGDYDTALDLLDQLETGFPASRFVYEAKLLRGYVHLARCEFEKADDLFQRYQGRFGAVVEQIDRVLESSARQARFYEELLAAERRERQREREATGQEQDDEPGRGDEPATVHELLLSMLQVDPTFYRLHAKIRILDSEAARAGRLASALAALRTRLQSGEEPKAAAERESYDTAAELLRADIEAARAALAGLTEQIDTMRRHDAPDEQLAPLEQQVQGLGERIDALEGKLEDELAGSVEGPEPHIEGDDDDVDALLRRDIAHARRLPARVSTVRAKLVDAANEAALGALRRLRSELAGGMRRARIGRIDAVMGSKRRIEIQIQSLAAGRFPPELQDPLRVQGLLRDDEEYWPFEGELWEDEFQEAVPLDEQGDE